MCRWWMGHYSGCTPKRHICWSNSRKIGGLDKGPLTKDERREIARTGVKSATIKVNKKVVRPILGQPNFVAPGEVLSCFMLCPAYTFHSSC